MYRSLGKPDDYLLVVELNLSDVNLIDELFNLFLVTNGKPTFEKHFPFFNLGRSIHGLKIQRNS